LFPEADVGYLDVVSDYDGIIATDGRATDAAIKAVGRLRASERRAVSLEASGGRTESIFSRLVLT
jgi:hypothetical protein